MKGVFNKLLNIIIVCCVIFSLFGCSSISKQEKTVDDIASIVESGLDNVINSGGGSWNNDTYTYVKVIDGIKYKSINEEVLRYLSQYDEKKEIVSVTGDQFDWNVTLSNGCLINGKVVLDDDTVHLGVAYKKGDYYNNQIDYEHYNSHKTTLDSLASLTKDIRYVSQDQMWSELSDIIGNVQKTSTCTIEIASNELSFFDFENPEGLQLCININEFEQEYVDQISDMSGDTVSFYNGIRIYYNSNYYSRGYTFISIRVTK